MSFLEKVFTLLTKEGRHIKYGTYTTESADPVVTLEVGESLPNFSHMGDQPAVEYQFLIVGFTVRITLQDSICWKRLNQN